MECTNKQRGNAFEVSRKSNEKSRVGTENEPDLNKPTTTTIDNLRRKTRKEKKVQTSKVSMVSSRSCFQRVAVVSPLGAPRWPFQVVISFGETETTKKKQKKTKT